MPASSFSFGGSTTRIPSVRVVVDTSGIGPPSLGGTKVIALLGIAKGGKPGVPLVFQTPTQAKNVLRGGELLTAVLRAFNPSNSQPGATNVMAIVVNPASPATLTLVDGSSANSIIVNSVNYGSLEIETVAVAAGSISGKKITIVDASGNTYIGDNLGENAFSVHYTGASSTMTMTIAPTLITLTSSGADGFTIDLTVATSINAVVNAINQHPGFAAITLTTNSNAPALKGLDGVTTTDVKGVTYTSTRNLQAIIDWFNGGAQGVVTATRPAAAIAVPANISATALTGGADIGNFHLDGTSNGGHTIDLVHDWQFAINQLLTQKVDFVVPIPGTQNSTDEDTLYAQVLAHCVLAAQDGRLRRHAIVGAQLAEGSSGSETAYIAHAKLLNSDRVAYTPRGFSDIDDITGVLTSYPAYIMAAQLAGLFCGITDVGNSITSLDVRGLGLEWLPNRTDLDVELANGIMPTEYDTFTGVIRCTRGISTWLADANFAMVEMSTSVALDTLVADLTQALQIYKGKKGSPTLVHQVASTLQTELIAEQNAGVIVGDASSPAWDNLEVTLVGDQIMAQLQASPGIPNNFIGLTVHATAFSGSVTIATGGASVSG